MEQETKNTKQNNDKMAENTATEQAETPKNGEAATVEDKDTAEQPIENEAQKEEAATEDEKKETTDEKSDSEKIIEQQQQKLAEYDARYKLLYADFENFRKRTNAEKADIILNGGKDVIKAILPVIDDLERALDAMGDDADAKEGVQLIYNKLMSTLKQKGLKPMEAKGTKFDDSIHEAVTRIPATTEEQKGMVFDVTEKGYYLNDKVLRFAKVVVAI